MQADIVVVGSLNVDMVVNINQRPEWGETVHGGQFFTGNGGKGGNQAFAASRLGATVAMIGKVGNDVFADQLLTSMNHQGVDTTYIEKDEGVSTGVALINVNDVGENCIIVSPGANLHVTPEYIKKYEQLIRHAKLVMVQLEIPLESVMEIAIIAKKYGVPLMLDPAPARILPDELYKLVTYIVPNESELGVITSREISDKSCAEVASTELLQKGVTTVFSKLGSKGVVVSSLNQTFTINPYKVNAIDSTAAGDAFAGALAAELVSGKDLQSATEFANAVGALTVTKKGAQDSMPNRIEAEEFIARYS
ncbi:ribokinase [Fredinandcohnia quinoae]|uniref:Ribokinase n=1 Tax=Fredinandcohnia quinoae TaxID=2918902 RepID=A0AAW5DVA7_9BACI|nr:ribokinase [Fredinandcohnia sp. SECRCQ15]MCH1624570.1 ribokinase [Fredinandcohnia sp. SECRCQ15]